MDKIEDKIDFINNGGKYFLPHMTVECTIFGYHEQKLKVLIGKWKGLNGWGLPSGYIGKEETLTNAAARILKERTGLENIFLQQFGTFGDSEYRTSVGLHLPPDRLPENNWLMQRTLSIGYYALIEYSKVKAKPDIFIERYKWQDVTNIPNLLFDHKEILLTALAAMRILIAHQPIGYNLLPTKFTLPEIQSLYETILNKSLDRRNFPKKLLSLEIIKKLDEKKNIGKHRAPYLYTFDKEKYNQALREGIVLSF